MIKFEKANDNKYNVCFRLLNSEIGNDQKEKEFKSNRLSFRLLNSEIGNDHKKEKT